ncbi:hypothetical protein BU17DRAFT_53907 [Hysterangium stoloniferum]|nr:hypothetical protein BU17DRAFT_53907 [Hysterangium stoloniferum]
MVKERKSAVTKPKQTKKRKKYDNSENEDTDIDGGGIELVARVHSITLHTIQNVPLLRKPLLEWFDTVRDTRGMPWRKPVLADPEQQAQRAYEVVWVSEIMLQQTQVATVIPYYTRWMEAFPTIYDLASSDIDSVNGLWKGLGYYSRASRLLAGAKKVVGEYDGRLPADVKVLEKEIPGIGRYSAGAICSIAYGLCAPVLDGNVHRLLSRVLALHASPKAKRTLDLLWRGAEHMVENSDRPGDVNQALIELGSTVCKVKDPVCQSCPLSAGCAAYEEDIEDACDICEPAPQEIAVTRFPMKAFKKKSRIETDAVNIIEWQGHGGRYFVLVRRPEGGLLAGLYEFPSTEAIDEDETDVLELPHLVLNNLLSSPPARFEPEKGRKAINSKNKNELRVTDICHIGDSVHIFSHIKKTYRIISVVLKGGLSPPLLREEFQQQNKKRKTHDVNKDRTGVCAKWVPENDVADSKIRINRDGGSWTLAKVKGDEIRHRFKELAGMSSCAVFALRLIRCALVIFHPDRQHHKDEHSIKLAEARFVQIQRAHDNGTKTLIVLLVYDTLGEEGLLASQALQHRYSSTDEVRGPLGQLRAELERLVNRSKEKSTTRDFVISHSSISRAYDATDVFDPGHPPGWEGLLSRWESITSTALVVENTTGVRLRDGTDATLTGRIQGFPSNQPSQTGLTGTVRHQFSPKITFQATANLFRLNKLDVRATYADNDNSVALRGDLHPKILTSFPRLSLEVQRRLFPDALTTGVLEISTRRQHPSFEATLLAPLEADRTFAWQSGLRFTPIPSVITELSTRPLSGGLKGRLNLEYGLRGLRGTVYGIWSGPRNTTVTVAVGASAQGPIYTDISYGLNCHGTLHVRLCMPSVRIDLSGHRLHIPIILSYEVDVMIGLCAVLVPSVVAATTHNLIIKPWLRTRRLAQLEEGRLHNRERIKQRRKEAEESSNILLDSAHRRTERERNIGGLVLLAGTYIASGDEDSSEDDSSLSVDVTVALQAQVHDSQLMIPGGRSKAGLLGFYDPSPGARKRLKVEYLFHDALHVAEVGDFAAVVLPLRGK